MEAVGGVVVFAKTFLKIKKETKMVFGKMLTIGSESICFCLFVCYQGTGYKYKISLCLWCEKVLEEIWRYSTTNKIVLNNLSSVY